MPEWNLRSSEEGRGTGWGFVEFWALLPGAIAIRAAIISVLK